jgi:hypothetical protein
MKSLGFNCRDATAAVRHSGAGPARNDIDLRAAGFLLSLTKG